MTETNVAMSSVLVIVSSDASFVVPFDFGGTIFWIRARPVSGDVEALHYPAGEDSTRFVAIRMSLTLDGTDNEPVCFQNNTIAHLGLHSW